MDAGGRQKSGSADGMCSVHRVGESTDDLLIGSSALFRQVLDIADSVAANDCVVLLEGESGTGKELIARRIHVHSSRSDGPFVPVNCPSISESLFESQFFGHVKGAFTGAAVSTLGMVRAAEDGTLLLDEVGELPLHLQPKLLRLLQEREVTPVGGSTPIPVNARFIAATNRSLSGQVNGGKFRRDLYHRLNVVRIEIPPLRARPEDIDPLVDHYLVHYARQYRMRPRTIGPGLRKALREYPWPGNVRELCCYLERLYAANLPPMPPGRYDWDDGYISEPIGTIEPPPERMPLRTGPHSVCSLEEAERKAIRSALLATGYNRSAAARLLDIHRSTLHRKLRQYGLDDLADPPLA
jgi:transcriptional regulator with PAS, ATPase and Fis domain